MILGQDVIYIFIRQYPLELSINIDVKYYNSD